MRLLLLTSTLAWPREMHGGAQRTALLLDALQRLGEVDIAFVARSPELAALAREAQAAGERIVGIFDVAQPHSAPARGFARLPLIGKPVATARKYLARYHPDPTLAEWLRNTLEQGRYDGVISRFMWAGAVAGVRAIGNVRTALDWDDLDHRKTRSQIEADPWPGLGGRIATALVVNRLTRFCRAEAAAYDHVWVAKPSDAQELPGSSVSVLPNIPFAIEERTQMEAGRRRTILFVGNQTYLPNSDALTHFLDTAWPRIHRQCPTARVLAVGPAPFPDVAARWLAHPGVEIAGAVDTLAPCYDQAALSVCPVEWGGGSNIKAVESLGHGVPCVMSPYSYDAFRGDFGPDTGMICARSPEDYVRACVGLLEEPPRAVAIGRAGQLVVGERYSRERFRQIVAAGLSAAGITG